MANFIATIWAWVLAHPTTITLFGYHVLSAFVNSLEMPSNQSGSFYRFFFKFTNQLAANYTRASASETAAGYKAPKPELIPGPEVPAPPKQP
jgi:hypothetical protein